MCIVFCKKFYINNQLEIIFSVIFKVIIVKVTNMESVLTPNDGKIKKIKMLFPWLQVYVQAKLTPARWQHS